MNTLEINSLKSFFPEYTIKHGNFISINRNNKEITIPAWLETLEENIFLGMIFFLFEKQENTVAIENENLEELESKQLTKLYNYIQTFLNVKDSIIFNKKEKIKKFFEFIAKKITAKWPLWEFIKEKLLNPENISINDLVAEYLNFKWLYLQRNCESCENIFDNELLEDEETYSEHDWLKYESTEWEDNWVIWFLNPAIRKTYFVSNILEWFDIKRQKFFAIKTNKQEVSPNNFEQVISYYNVSWKTWKIYTLPINFQPKSPINFNQNIWYFFNRIFLQVFYISVFF